MHVSVILASASPRRKELLAHIINDFKIAAANIDETPNKNESAQALVLRLATEKAQHIANNCSNNTLVIGSDTVVAINNKILGKPTDYQDFSNMMALLSQQTHQVYTGVSLIKGSQCLSVVVNTNVMMSKISQNDAQTYWQTGEPSDKAGGYAIQGIGGQFVKSIDGSFSAVVGLPICETKELLKQMLSLSQSN